MKLRCKLSGLDGVLGALQDLGETAAAEAVLAGTREATSLIVAEAKARVAVDTGALKKSLGRKVKTYRRGKVVVGIVGPRTDAEGKPAKHARTVRRKGSAKETVAVPAWYAHLVEFGTAPHAVGAGDHLARAARGRRKAQGSVQTGKPHPGSPPRPFLRPAWEACKEASFLLLQKQLAVAVKNTKPRGR